MNTPSRRPIASHAWERESDNWYVEPTWVTQRLCEVETFHGRTVDPCAGLGQTLIGAAAADVSIEGMDLRNRGNPAVVPRRDFFARRSPIWAQPVDNIISNPPYGRNHRGIEGERPRLEEQFLQLALKRTRSKVALFLLSGWISAEERGAWLETLPLYRIYHVSPRPSCPPGQIIQRGERAQGGRHNFCWYVFLHGFSGPPTTHFLRRDG